MTCPHQPLIHYILRMTRLSSNLEVALCLQDIFADQSISKYHSLLYNVDPRCLSGERNIRSFHSFHFRSEFLKMISLASGCAARYSFFRSEFCVVLLCDKEDAPIAVQCLDNFVIFLPLYVSFRCRFPHLRHVL